jgi:polysaccharide export outer membrane protein
MSVSPRVFAALAAAFLAVSPGAAQQPAAPAPAQQNASYVVGPQDVLVITSYDQPELTGKFTVETDGTFTYPLIGRIRVTGMTLRDVEALLRKELVAQGFFRDPQVAVAIEQYRSQKVYIVGEIRSPGAYPLSGDMRLVEALALAGSTLPTASGEAVVVHASTESVVVDTGQLPALPAADPGVDDPSQVTRVDLRLLENGDLSQNVPLRNGDTIFVLRAESVYVFGQVKNPGAYPLRQKDTTVLQALSLAGGVTDRGSTGRIQIVRIVDGKKQEIRADLTDFVLPRDTIIVPERFF